jgi:diguanylate cyclase (GGDEF)-like protein
MQKGATEIANDAYLHMTDAYRAHRAAIDEVVKLAGHHNTQLERSASDRERSVLATILALSLGVVGLVIVCIIGSISWVVRPISRLQDVMRKLAAGDLDAVIPFTRRRDEIGQMAGAVQVFHDNAVERSRLNREARLLSELNEWLQSCKSLEELYGMVGEFIAKLLPSCSGNLYIYANSRDILENAKGWNDAQATAAIHPDDCWGLRRGHTYTFGDREITFPCAHVGASQDAYCCIPILAHGETIGLLHLRFEQGVTACSPVVAEQRRLAMMCAEQISLAIANVKLRDQLRDQSIRDTLTGLFNRRYLMETCRREFSRASRAGQSVSFLSIDVDHFKKFNDNHGHDAGDTVLRAVGDCLRTSFREDDVACRFGGEEFVVVLPGADSAIATRKADELRQKVQALVVRYMDGNLPRITISIGVASFPQAGTTIEEVLKAADQALYCAKEQGRNTVRISPEDTLPAVGGESRWPVAAE